MGHSVIVYLVFNMLCQSKPNPFIIDNFKGYLLRENSCFQFLFSISTPDPQQTLKLVLGNTSIGNDTLSDFSFYNELCSNLN